MIRSSIGYLIVVLLLACSTRSTENATESVGEPTKECAQYAEAFRSCMDRLGSEAAELGRGHMAVIGPSVNVAPADDAERTKARERERCTEGVKSLATACHLT